MINLQDTPSSGPLTADDLARYRAMHRPYIPDGCTQQGRYTQAAEACTDLGADDDLAAASGIVHALAYCLALYAVGILMWVVLS